MKEICNVHFRRKVYYIVCLVKIAGLGFDVGRQGRQCYTSVPECREKITIGMPRTKRVFFSQVLAVLTEAFGLYN